MPDISKYQQFIDLTSTRTRYYEAGSGPNHLILIHGMGVATSASSYRFILEDLAKTYHVYAMDMPGFGMSNRTIEEGPTFDMAVDQVREFMDAKGIEKASFIGHSLGGWVSALLSYESPQRVNKLVMMCSAGMNVPPSPDIETEKIPSLEEIEEEIRKGFKDKSRLPDDAELRAMATETKAVVDQPGALHSLDPWLHQMKTPNVRKRYLLQRRLSGIKAPTLVMWGEGDFMDPYPTWTEEYASLKGDMSKSSKPWVIPNACYVVMPTGHYPLWEMPAETLSLLNEFLAS